MQNESKPLILLVDDEPDILDMLAYNLSKEGFTAITADNGQKAIEMALEHKPDLIIMDVMMPVMDGIEACVLIRKEPSIANSIIMFLSARGEDFTQVAGFDAGADDFVTKPVKPRLLISKVKALLRRSSQSLPIKNSTTVSIDRDRYVVVVEGQDKVMPKKEFELIALLCSQPGTVFSRDQILKTVWGTDVIVNNRTIDVHIRKLREKIGNKRIVTLKGVGYKFVDIA